MGMKTQQQNVEYRSIDGTNIVSILNVSGWETMIKLFGYCIELSNDMWVIPLTQ